MFAAPGIRSSHPPSRISCRCCVNRIMSLIVSFFPLRWGYVSLLRADEAYGRKDVRVLHEVGHGKDATSKVPRGERKRRPGGVSESRNGRAYASMYRGLSCDEAHQILCFPVETCLSRSVLCKGSHTFRSVLSGLNLFRAWACGRHCHRRDW